MAVEASISEAISSMLASCCKTGFAKGNRNWPRDSAEIFKASKFMSNVPGQETAAKTEGVIRRLHNAAAKKAIEQVVLLWFLANVSPSTVISVIERIV